MRSRAAELDDEAGEAQAVAAAAHKAEAASQAAHTRQRQKLRSRQR